MQSAHIKLLRLHSKAFMLELFSQPRHKHILHTRFLHSIVSHAPLLFKIISLRSVNAETHERMFGQMKQITKATSNYHPNKVITNALICMHEEGKATGIDTHERERGWKNCTNTGKEKELGHSPQLVQLQFLTISGSPGTDW